MGLLASHIHFLSMENTKHPISGDVLTLGQQDVYTTIENAIRIISSYGISNTLGSDFDTKPKIDSWIGTSLENNTNAQAVFTLLGADKVYACDYSDYENPDFTFDLNYPVGEEYKEKFDVIFDSGTLEHVFDVPAALKNINYMLKKGGRMIIFSPSSNSIDHGFYSFSPTLFFDYFESLAYKNMKAYLRETNPYNTNFKGKSYEYTEVGDQLILFSILSVELYFFATKGSSEVDLNNTKKPIQSLYTATYNESNISPVMENSKTKKILKKVSKFLPNSILMLVRSYISEQKIKDIGTNIKYIGRY
jgi:SAM-dependent methyltransferase